MNITFPENTKEVIDAIRGAIGRDVTFVSRLVVPCSSCIIDPITNTSTNSFCPVCSGNGYVYTFSGTTISAHVTHQPSEITQWYPGGQYIFGDCRLQIEYTEENLNAINSADYVTIDNKKFDVRSKIYRGVRQLNRILIDLLERQE